MQDGGDGLSVSVIRFAVNPRELFVPFKKYVVPLGLSDNNFLIVPFSRE